MAVHLNTPGEFTTKRPPASPLTSGMSHPKLELLPPSVFDTPSPGVEDPWKALGRATNEILQLRNELDKLRDMKHITLPVGEEIRARVDLHHSPSLRESPIPSAAEVNHYSDLINRQAAEISDLRKSLASTEREHQMALAKLESQILVKDVQFEQQRAALQSELDNSKIKHADELQKVKDNYERDLASQRSRILHLEKDMKILTESRDTEVTRLERSLAEVTLQLESTRNAVQADIKTKEKTIEDQTRQIAQLKKYITETAEGCRSTEAWRRDVESLKMKLRKQEREGDDLKSNNQLLVIRLDSLNKVMSLQEQEMTKKTDNLQNKDGSNVLTRWREKVYQLMVQQKSTEISHRQLENTWKNRLQELEQELKSKESQREMLQLSLQDKQAEMALLTNQVQWYEEEIRQAQDVALSLDERSQEDRKTGQILAQCAHSVYEQYEKLEALVLGTQSSLNAYNDRIAYASGRLQILESQLVRKQALSKLHEDSTRIEIPTRDTETESVALSHAEHLQWELDRVTKERDHLASVIRQDAQFLEGKIQAAKEQYADEAKSLNQRMHELHNELQDTNEKLSSVSQTLSKKEEELEEAKQLIESLEDELDNKQAQMERELAKQLAKESSALNETLIEMEQKVNNAKREQTKAVVSLRQAERQHERERQQAQERYNTLDSHFKSEVSRLENKLRSLQAERNLLMNTIRQEGLMNKVTSQRGHPIDLGKYDEEPVRETDTNESKALSNSDDEPLHAVIDDLRSLMPAVLQDIGSSSNEDGAS